MKNERKPSSKLWLWIVGLVPVVILVLWHPVIRPMRQRARARHDVEELVLGLKAYIITFKAIPRGTTAEVCAILRGEDVRGQNAHHEPVVEKYETNADGEFIDPWGTPFHIIVEPMPRVYSCGPNRVDDQGRGDDIAAE